uniref:CLIP domain-containing serine protease n=1 Tax=Diabrotica virgifera virgifera TaxID=50390 RepID=A0A6P7FL11_DIAVI
MVSSSMAFFGNSLLFMCFMVAVKSQGFWGNANQGCRTPTGETGDCIPARQCRALITVLQTVKRPLTPSVTKQLNAYYCSFAYNMANVCCPQGPIILQDDSSQEVQQDPPDVSNHRNLRLLPPDCGYLDIPNKIRNGQNAEINEFPWMTLLRYRTSTGAEFRCGGTIINNKYILTAAHCITRLKDPLLDVRVGEYNTSSVIDCVMDQNGIAKCINDPIQNLAIEEIIPHPEFNPNVIANDIGLLRVSRMNINAENARPVCLPLGEHRLDEFRRVTVTGWGYTDSYAEVKTDVLQKVDLPIVPINRCREAYKGQSSKARLTYKQLCAGGQNNQDACPGDSGGPLQVARLVDGSARYIQHGVVSFGPRECGFEGFPGIYTRVAYYMDWILDNMRR